VQAAVDPVVSERIKFVVPSVAVRAMTAGTMTPDAKETHD
jgi:hypothetical protein